MSAALAVAQTPARSPVQKAPVAPLGAEATTPNPKADDPGRARCINVDRIRSTKVRDDETIAVRMAGGERLLIKLRQRCYGLSFDESFYYNVTPARQLCARLDMITARSGSRCLIDSIVPDPSPPEKGKR
jgi:hypothetical protein